MATTQAEDDEGWLYGGKRLVLSMTEVHIMKLSRECYCTFDKMLPRESMTGYMP